MKTLKSYKNRIPSDISVICSTVQEIIDYLQNSQGAIAECCLFELKVILNELIINAVKHGNHCSPDKYVDITAGMCPGRYVYVIVEDQGEGYDYNKIMVNNNECSDPFTCLFDLKETGRGIMIVKNLCESVRFNRNGNKVVVLKKLIVQ